MPSVSYELRHPASASCLGRHARLAGRCPNNSSLFPPLAAVVVVALGILSGRIILNFGISERLRAFRYPIFTREKGPRSVRRRSGGRNYKSSFR